VFKNILERVKHALQMPLHFFRASKRTREEEHIDMTDTFSHQQLKTEIVERLEEKFGVTLMRRRSYFEHLANGRRFIIAVSKRYKDMPQDYWYGYNSSQQSHLAGGVQTATLFLASSTQVVPLLCRWQR
jgi:hypothetical protein